MQIQEVIEDRRYLTIGHDQALFVSRYGNANGFAWCYTAVVTIQEGGRIIDWTAYLGGCDLTQHESDCVEWVAAKGNKVSKRDALYFFDFLPEELYRE